MKNIEEHLLQSVTTVATCFKLSLKNNTVVGFTDFDQNLEIDGVTYNASSGFDKSSIEVNTDLSMGNLTISGLLNNPIITELDLIAGKYNGALIEIFLVNYNDLSQGKLILKNGFLSEIKIIDGKFYIGVNGLSSKLNSSLGELYSPNCRAKLGDKRCKVDLTSYTKTGAIITVVDEVSFIGSNLKEVDHYYDYGDLSFISGKNQGFITEVKSYMENTITLYNKTPYVISVGDSYVIVVGCNKKFSTCSLKFKNAENFRGEPHVPGNEQTF